MLIKLEKQTNLQHIDADFSIFLFVHWRRWRVVSAAVNLL